MGWRSSRGRAQGGDYSATPRSGRWTARIDEPLVNIVEAGRQIDEIERERRDAIVEARAKVELVPMLRMPLLGRFLLG